LQDGFTTNTKIEKKNWKQGNAEDNRICILNSVSYYWIGKNFQKDGLWWTFTDWRVTPTHSLWIPNVT
jgi:hypothetical protein